MCTAISFPGVPGVNCSRKAASHVCRRARPACLLPQTHTVYSIHRIEKLRRICSREESAGHGNNLSGSNIIEQGRWLRTPRDLPSISITWLRFRDGIQYVFVSRELMNLRFIQNIIMTGLSNSFIANTDSVLCILCIFCGSALSLPQILLSLRFSYHYNSYRAKKLFCLFTADLTSISRAW